VASITLKQQDSQDTPASGDSKIYIKTDGKAYLKDATGAETLVGGGAVPGTHAASHKGDGADAIAAATTSVAGLLPAADKVKLNGLTISGGGAVPGTHAASHKGDGADAIAAATTSVAGLLSATDKVKLDAITPGETNATSIKGYPVVFANSVPLNKRGFYFDSATEDWLEERIPCIPYSKVHNKDWAPTAEEFEENGWFLIFNTGVVTNNYVGNATVATLNGLSPSVGAFYVVTNSGTLTLGSVAVTVGDVVYYNGTIWVKAISGTSGGVLGGVRLQLSSTLPLISPYTDGTDDGKIVAFQGGSVTGDFTAGPIVLTLPAPTNFPNDACIRGIMECGNLGGAYPLVVQIAGGLKFSDGLEKYYMSADSESIGVSVVNGDLKQTWVRTREHLNVLQVRRAATWGHTNFGGYTAIPFDTEDREGNPYVSGWNSGSNPTRLTVLIPGEYTFTGNMSFNRTGGLEYQVSAKLRKNGTSDVAGTIISGGGFVSNTALALSRIVIVLEAGDYLEWLVTHTGFQGNLRTATVTLTRSI